MKVRSSLRWMGRAAERGRVENMGEQSEEREGRGEMKEEAVFRAPEAAVQCTGYRGCFS